MNIDVIVRLALESGLPVENATKFRRDLEIFEQGAQSVRSRLADAVTTNMPVTGDMHFFGTSIDSRRYTGSPDRPAWANEPNPCGEIMLSQFDPPVIDHGTPDDQF